MHTCTARGHLSITSHGKTDRSPCQDGSSARENLNLIVMVLRFAGLFLALLPALVIPILSSFPKMLKNSTANTCWLLTAALLAAAVSTPISGRLGDMYGKRRMFLVRMILLVTGSTVGIGDALGLPLSAIIVQVTARARFDVPEGVGITVRTVALVLTISKGEMEGWTSLPMACCFELGVAVAVAAACVGMVCALAIPRESPLP